MKFRNTIQLGAVLLLLIIGYFFWQNFQRYSAQEIEAAKRIFDFEATDIRELTVHQLDQKPTTAVRTEGADGEGGWSITEPNPNIEAFDTLWNRVAEQAAGLMNERTIPADDPALEAYGLHIPRLTIGLEAKGTEHELIFGYLEPTQRFRYARLDDGPVFLADKDAVFELDRPLDLLRDAYIVDDHLNPVYKFEYAPIIQTEAQREAYKKKFDVEAPEIGTEADTPIIVERASEEAPWVQLSPVSTAANQEKVNELVKEIQFARGRHWVDEPESYADYGLDPAYAKITIENGEGGGGRQSFYMGDVANLGEVGGVWVRKEGEDSVFLIDAHITKLYPRMNALRERRLITQPIGDYTTLEYIGRDARFTLARDEGGAWEMVDPPLDDTDELYVTQYIAALKSVEGIQFYPGAPADYGLDNPEATLRFAGAAGKAPLEIRLTPNPDQPGQYYALTDAGEIAGVPEEHIAFAVTSAQQFRLMSLLQFPPARAVKMNFQIDGVEYALQKEHTRWLVASPENRFLPNQSDALKLLQAVAGLRAVAAEEDEEGEPGAYGFDMPRFTFTATLAPEEAGDEEETVGPLEIGGVVPGIDGQRFARSAARQGVFRVKQSFIETVTASVSGIQTTSGAGGSNN